MTILETALTELYATAPEGFLDARKGLAAKLKAEGHPAEAKEVLAAKKPTRVAHLLNRLSREHAPEVAALVNIGERLARAQAPDALRETIAHQRQAVQSLAGKAAELIKQLDMPPAELSTITAVLFGATTSPERAAELVLGRFSKAPEATSSFAGVTFATAPEPPAPVAGPTPAPDSPHAKPTLVKAPPEADQAHDAELARQQKLRHELEVAEQVASENQKTVTTLQAAFDALAQKADALEQAAKQATEAAVAAEDRAARAEEALDEAKAAAERSQKDAAALRAKVAGDQ